MMRKILFSIAVLTLVFMVSACAKLTLKHTPLTPADASVGSVSLLVNNDRPKDHGAENEKHVGDLRNLYGMPIGLEAENSLVDAVKALYTDALKNAGYLVTEDAPAQVVVDIAIFFLDGYMGYKMEATFKVKANKGDSAVWETEITKSHGFGHMKNQDLYDAYDKFMDMIAVEAVAAFKTPEFQAAVQ